jgi:hypothetical protein
LASEKKKKETLTKFKNKANDHSESVLPCTNRNISSFKVAISLRLIYGGRAGQQMGECRGAKEEKKKDMG